MLRLPGIVDANSANGRHWLSRVAPVAVWLAAVAGAWWLYRSTPGQGEAAGVAEVRQYTISPAETGRLASVEVAPGERVFAGAVVARLDTEILEREIAVAEAELREIEAQIPAEGRSLELARLEAERTFRAQLEQAEVDLQDARAAFERERGEMAAVQAELERQRSLVERRLADRRRLEDLEVRLAALRESVASWPERRKALEDRLRAAQERLEGWRAAQAGRTGDDARRDRLRPLELRLIRQREYLELLRKRLKNMTLRAPADAYVASIISREGTVVRPGDPVMVLVEAEPAQVIAYVDEASGADLAVGDPVTLRSRDRVGKSIPGTVAGVARTVSELPPRFWRHPSRPRWGREVFVRIAPGHSLDPGEAFDVSFHRGRSPGGPVAASAESTMEPVALTVPAALAARTRFEPSGLAWAAGLGRYLVVSDDTGFEAAEDNAPWVFALRPDGAVEAEPVPIRGCEAVSDLEAIAMSPEGRVYLLASQSLNQRGRRPPARTLFVAARLEGRALVAEGQVRLHDLVREASRRDPAFLASLGLEDESRPSGPNFEVEGLAWWNGALYLGLKAPLDNRRRALIWRLARPEALFREGSLLPAGLSLWGRVLLEVEGEPAGISELLFTATGRLLVAATNDKGGGVFSVTAGGEELRAEPVRSFPGLKPEGLSLTPDGRRLVVVFDCQQDTPLWAQLDIPH